MAMMSGPFEGMLSPTPHYYEVQGRALEIARVMGSGRGAADSTRWRRPCSRRRTRRPARRTTPRSCPMSCRFVWAIDVLPDELGDRVGQLMDAGLTAIKSTLEAG
jgi:hypothetical protein